MSRPPSAPLPLPPAVVPSPIRPTSRVPGEGEPARILVVDDDTHTRELLGDLCAALGHVVISASDGREALALATAEPLPELVLLDVMMPELDGFSVLATLRSRPSTARMPVIVLTAASDIDGKLRGLELGADDYVTKPFRVAELRRRLETVLSLHRTRRRLEAAELALEGVRGGTALEGAAGFPLLKSGLEYEAARARRYRRPLSVLLLVFDDWSQRRSGLGRQALDALLAETTAALRACLREPDRLFRIDEEEYVVVLPETDGAGARGVLERLQRSLQPSVVIGGLAMLDEVGTAGADELLRTARRDLTERHPGR